MLQVVQRTVCTGVCVPDAVRTVAMRVEVFLLRNGEQVLFFEMCIYVRAVACRHRLSPLSAASPALTGSEDSAVDVPCIFALLQQGTSLSDCLYIHVSDQVVLTFSDRSYAFYIVLVQVFPSEWLLIVKSCHFLYKYHV